MPELGVREWAAVGRAIVRGRVARYGADGEGEVDRFERRLATRMGVSHALAVNSGTSALTCALAAAEIGPGDEVLVPAYTWVATAAAVVSVGAMPILVDIDESLTMDPEDAARKIAPQTKAIIVVHMNNLVCDLDAFAKLASDHGLVLIEDACQSIGVPYKGRATGSHGALGAFSFNRFKNMNAGEGGAVLTNDTRLITRARMQHDVGSYTRGKEDYNEPVFVGQNFRVSELQGAILNVQLSRLDGHLRRRRRKAKMLREMMNGTGALTLSPHNDPEAAMAVSVVFEDQERAQRFASEAGCQRAIDSGRHVFTHWKPVMEMRTFHPALNPLRWSTRNSGVDQSDCARTLDILARTCHIPLNPDELDARTYLRGKRITAWAG